MCGLVWGGGLPPTEIVISFSGMPCLAGEVAAVVLVIWHVPEYRSHEISRTLHFKEIRSVFPICWCFNVILLAEQSNEKYSLYYVYVCIMYDAKFEF